MYHASRFHARHLTGYGTVTPRLYESPFTDVSPAGPDSLFEPALVDQLFAVLAEVGGGAVT